MRNLKLVFESKFKFTIDLLAIICSKLEKERKNKEKRESAERKCNRERKNYKTLNLYLEWIWNSYPPVSTFHSSKK